MRADTREWPTTRTVQPATTCARHPLVSCTGPCTVQQGLCLSAYGALQVRLVARSGQKWAATQKHQVHFDGELAQTHRFAQLALHRVALHGRLQITFLDRPTCAQPLTGFGGSDTLRTQYAKRQTRGRMPPPALDDLRETWRTQRTRGDRWQGSTTAKIRRRRERGPWRGAR